MESRALTVIETKLDVGKAIRGVPLFEGLSDTISQKLCELAEPRFFRAGQTVFSHGQYDGREFLVIISGWLRSAVMDASAANMIIEDYKDGDIFALEFAFADEAAQAMQFVSASAEDNLHALSFDSEAFIDLALHRPTLMRSVTQYLARSLSAQRLRAEQMEATPERRIYAALVEIAERSSGAEWRIRQMPKHRELAEIAGVQDAEAASAVAALIQQGVARREYPGLIISDYSRLAALAS